MLLIYDSDVLSRVFLLGVAESVAELRSEPSNANMKYDVRGIIRYLIPLSLSPSLFLCLTL